MGEQHEIGQQQSFQEILDEVLDIPDESRDKRDKTVVCFTPHARIQLPKTCVLLARDTQIIETQPLRSASAFVLHLWNL